MLTKVAKKTVLDHETAKDFIAEAFNAQTILAMKWQWVPDAMKGLADRRREVLEYLEHLRLTAEGREIRR
jgi:hypothetical protein